MKSLIIAFSTYSKVPMPRIEWNEKSMKYSMCFFPFVGAVIGLLSVFCLWIMNKLGFGSIATAAVLTVLPVIINGGIHMDGFLDTMDALSSWKTREERLVILKDPHMGAFACIYGIVYMLIVFGLFSEITGKEIILIAFGYVYSRILSGISVVTFKKAKRNGMLAATADASEKNVKWILIAELILFAVFMLYYNLLMGAVCLVAGALSFVYYRFMSYRVFDGITGDLAGFFLQICELVILFAVVIMGKIIA